MSSIARATIAKAGFFLDRAHEAGPGVRDAYCNYLEASIVFARSVTFHLQKECADLPGFAEWYAVQQKSLGQNPLARFLLEQRNYVLKEGPIATHRVMAITSTTSIHVSVSASVEVIRGAPWYKRSPRILWNDATYPFRAKLHSLRTKRLRRKRDVTLSNPLIEQHQSSDVTGDAIFFANEEWKAVPAIILVRRLLDKLDGIVTEAERRFPSPGKSVGEDDAAA